MKKSLMKPCLLMPVIFLTACCFAQNAVQSFSIKGIAIDSATGQPLAYVTVTLQNHQSLKSIKTTLTKGDGSFVIKEPKGSAYNLVLSFVGYNSQSVLIPAESSDTDAGTFMMTRAVAKLKEISVRAARPVVSREVDKLVYDVQADP
ncbi:MAG TPA: carboxypeptidase-like regulatory domain-containing protein, partial [Puia sp.]|nr:carboxypeptidase-like regulatory domain-containing protein [Puia sp.]